MGSKPIGISASRGSAVLGMNPFSTPLMVWQLIMEEKYPGFNKKQKFAQPPPPKGAALEWGLKFEDSIIDICEKKSGKLIISKEKLFKHPKKKFLTCHVDGIYKRISTIHEGKTTSNFIYRDKWGKPGTDRIPKEYQIQVQHQMLCTGLKKAIVSVLVFPKQTQVMADSGVNIKKIDVIKWGSVLNEMGYFYQYEVKANKKLHTLMLKNYSVWWKDHILGKKPPKAKSYDDIRRICQDPVGTMISTDTIERFISEYKNIGSEIGYSGRLHKRRVQLKVLIINWMRKQSKKQKTVLDRDSREKWIIRNTYGKKIAQYSKHMFRG